MVEQKKIRLHQVATELNVSKDTIADYLAKNGFDISNKPTSLITNAMIESLLKGFIREKRVAESFKKKFLLEAALPEKVQPASQTKPDVEAQEQFKFIDETLPQTADVENKFEFVEEFATKSFQGEEVAKVSSEPKVGDIIDLDKFAAKPLKDKQKKKTQVESKKEVKVEPKEKKSAKIKYLKKRSHQQKRNHYPRKSLSKSSPKKQR